MNTALASRTFNNLADPAQREVTTIYTTNVRVDEDNDLDRGVRRVAVTTSHNKGRKVLETRVNTETLTDSGFIRRYFVIFQPSTDAGITIAQEPIARFSAKRAWELHDFAVSNLDALLTAEMGNERTGAVAATILSLLHDGHDAA